MHLTIFSNWLSQSSYIYIEKLIQLDHFLEDQDVCQIGLTGVTMKSAIVSLRNGEA